MRREIEIGMYWQDRKLYSKLRITNFVVKTESQSFLKLASPVDPASAGLFGEVWLRAPSAVPAGLVVPRAQLARVVGKQQQRFRLVWAFSSAVEKRKMST
jgi:hypothetical protein